MRLADQWNDIHASLTEGWEEARLELTFEDAAGLARAAGVLGPVNAGRLGDGLVLTVRSAGYPGPEQIRRLFAKLDASRTWGTVALARTTEAEAPAVAAADASHTRSVAEAWDEALASLPVDWTELLCALDLESSALLPRAALLCAPINPTRDRDRIGFTFRCSGRSGYGVAPGMARVCFARLDEAGIAGSVTVLRVLSDVGNVDTQGTTWLVGGRNL